MLYVSWSHLSCFVIVKCNSWNTSLCFWATCTDVWYFFFTMFIILYNELPCTIITLRINYFIYTRNKNSAFVINYSYFLIRIFLTLLFIRYLSSLWVRLVLVRFYVQIIFLSLILLFFIEKLHHRSFFFYSRKPFIFLDFVFLLIIGELFLTLSRWILNS